MSDKVYGLIGIQIDPKDFVLKTLEPASCQLVDTSKCAIKDKLKSKNFKFCPECGLDTSILIEKKEINPVYKDFLGNATSSWDEILKNPMGVYEYIYNFKCEYLDETGKNQKATLYFLELDEYLPELYFPNRIYMGILLFKLPDDNCSKISQESNGYYHQMKIGNDDELSKKMSILKRIFKQYKIYQDKEIALHFISRYSE